MIHPGSVVLDSLHELGWTARRLARAMGYSEKHLSLVLNGKARVSPDFAIRYARATGHSPRRLLHAQADHDLREAINAGH